MTSQEDNLNNYYDRTELNLDDGEKLIREIQDLREMLNEYQGIIESLIDRSRDILPLPMRRNRLTAPVQLRSLCSYKQLNVRGHIYSFLLLAVFRNEVFLVQLACTSWYSSEMVMMMITMKKVMMMHAYTCTLMLLFWKRKKIIEVILNNFVCEY